MSLKEKWNAEETQLGKFVHKYLSIALTIMGAMPELLMWFGTLPPGTVPQGFWTFGIVAGGLAKIIGKTQMNK
jgi:hypothetical protein